MPGGGGKIVSEVTIMNKIQAKGEYKTQRKQRMRAVALPQITASKIPHPKSSEHSQIRPILRTPGTAFEQEARR